MTSKQLTIYLITAVVFFAMGVFTGEAKADEFSVSTLGLNTQSSFIYTNQNHRIQYNFDLDDTYIFGAVERIQVCPYYCGVTFSLFGAGIGKNIDFGKVELFGQIGAYYVENNFGEGKWNENIYYYMTNKFGKQHFVHYQVDNGNAFSGSVGVKIPFSKNTGMQFYYQHTQFWVNWVAHINKKGAYWHDPTTLKFTGYGVGLYARF